MHVRVCIPEHFVSYTVTHATQNIGDGNIKMTEKRETIGVWKDDECIVIDMIQDLRLTEGEGIESTKPHQTCLAN